MGAGGRLIELVCHINGLDTREVSRALRILDGVFPHVVRRGKAYKPHRTISQYSNQKPQSTLAQVVGATGLKRNPDSIEILAVTEVYAFPLKEYITKTRGIPFNIASHYLKEVKCRTKDQREFYALGFASGRTYALRNKHFKGFAGAGVDIRIFEQGTPEIIMFEGFIDYLSYLAAKRLLTPDKTAIVLNGYAMIGRAIHHIQNVPGIKVVEFFRDRDEVLGKSIEKNTGLQTLKKLQAELGAMTIIDRSDTYPEFKDLNDWRTNLVRPKDK